MELRKLYWVSRKGIKESRALDIWRIWQRFACKYPFCPFSACRSPVSLGTVNDTAKMLHFPAPCSRLCHGTRFWPESYKYRTPEGKKMTSLGKYPTYLSLLSVAWNINMMHRAPAVILDHKVTLRTENMFWDLEEKKRGSLSLCSPWNQWLALDYIHHIYFS